MTMWANCCLPLLLLAASRAQLSPAAPAASAAPAAPAAPAATDDNCTVVETGTLSGLMGVHTEMLLPGQHSVIFTIPPVCSIENGARAVACEVAAAAPAVALRGAGGGRGRVVALARRGDAAGFAMLSVALYCRPW